ncbi:O-antigen ligase family protein [Jatrophihabitans sp. YIM 134969]
MLTTVYLLIMLAATAVALGFDGPLRWASIAVITALAVAVATRSGPARIGTVLAVVAAGTAPWNAVAFGGLRPGDVALAGAVVFLLFSGRTFGEIPRVVLPAWLLVLVGAVAALTAAHELIPIDPEYLASRLTLDAVGGTTDLGFTNVGIGGRWLVSLIGLPVLCVLAQLQGRRVLKRLALAYVAGTAVSGIVAVTDSLGVTAISAGFIVPDSGGRQAGLTVHPNHLAASACLAVPFVFWAFTRGRRRLNVFASVALVALLAATYESGSRGGAVCVVLASALTLVLVRDLRSRLPLVVGGLFGLMFVVFGLYPDAVSQLLTSVRLSNGAGVDASDQVRATLGAQGTADFRHSPFFGIGMQVGLDAHNIYRQLLAAGGIILFGCFVAFAVGALRCALRLGQRYPLAFAAAASISAWLLFGMVENLLTDRFLYVPVGILVALVQKDRDDAREQEATGLVLVGAR